MSNNGKTLKECWDLAGGPISAAIGESDYTNWFTRIFYDKEDGNKLFLKVSSNLVLQTLNTRFLPLIKETVEEFYGDAVTIEAAVGKKETVIEKPASAVPETAVSVAKPSAKNKKADDSLNPNYTFDSFVPGENIFAFNACNSIAENPGGNYNPLLIYGGVGLGKTHLLQAIGNHLASNTKMKIRYVTAENYTNEFIDSINSRTTQQFKNKYRKVDILLMDDIQFLENKEAVQTEMFNTFNDLYETGRQLVFTCDRPVHELKNLTERLRNRFERGLSIDMQPPAYETRMAILKKKSAELDLIISDSILSYVAENVQSNVRDLEACLKKLDAYSKLINRNITIEVARELLKNSIRLTVEKSNTSIDQIIKCVASYFSISTYDIKGKSKKKSIAYARQIAMYLANKYTDYSTTEIGIEFNGKDHSTVLHAIEKIKTLLDTPGSETVADINELNTMLRAGKK